MSYILSRSEVREYSHVNQYAVLMFNDAGEDYTSSRCLNHNLLVKSGFPLYSMAVEKLLKALIFLESGKQTKLKGSAKHNVLELKNELQTHKSYDLDKYDDLLLRIYGYWQHRYFDNPNQANGMRGPDIKLFDEFWVHIFKQLPIPLEVLYRTSYLTSIFNDKPLTISFAFRKWTFDFNDPFKLLEKEMEQHYNAVFTHLYPSN